MAYNVKFRLEFSDDLENGKKIEILKKDYSSTGTVYDLVGAAEPCIITWQGDDNFYTPIKGSQCTINLFETDDTNYDNFYEFNEREYQVKIYYKDSSNNYQLYWIGWLVVDTFKEAITTKPFGISLTALDGLGTLNGFDMPLGTATSNTGLGWIRKCLDNLDLNLDIHVSQDIENFLTGASDYTIYDNINITTYNLQKDKLDINNAKHILEQVLKITNARIFQSFGKWYIINNSSYSGQAVKDSSASTAQGGTIPTGIRTAEANNLTTNGTELPKFVVYNYQGTYQSASNVNVLVELPTNLKPIDNNLTKEYLRPLNKFEITHKTSQYLKDKFTVLQNSGFENDLAYWSTYTATSTTSPGEISDDFAKQGNQSFKNTQTQTSANTRKTLTYSNGYGVTNNTAIGHVLKVNTYFKSSSTYASSTEVSFRWVARIEDEDPIPPQDDPYYWNNSTESWVQTTTPIINTQVADSVDAWEEYKFDLGSSPYTGNLYLDFYEPYVEVSGHLEALYYDNITLDIHRIDGSELFPSIDGFEYSRVKTQAGDSGVLQLNDLQLSSNNYNNTNITRAVRPRDDNANFVKSLEEIISQQVLNDYRDHLIRYEGKLYNLDNDPIGLQNKIWVNFGSSVLRESVSCIIDSMTYNVKRNAFEVIMHIPNQDDDEASTFRVKF